jgi:hypothetical protein
MEAAVLQHLVVELFTAVNLLSGYPVPDTLPEIHSVPAAIMQEKICHRPCPVKAYYHPDVGVYIDQDLDLTDDVFARSILLHELVHHVQHTTGKFEIFSGFCVRKNAEEMEAYKIQNLYLSHEHSAKRAVYMGWASRCKEEVAIRPDFS